MSEIPAFLSEQLPDALSHDPKNPNCIFNWLQLAETLQLDCLHEICMCKFRDMAYNKQLEPLLINQVPSNPTYIPPKPTCPNGHHASKSCMKWCATCIAWKCGINMSACQRCITSLTSGPSPVRWSRSSKPEPSIMLKSLSHETLEQMVASLVASTGGSYIPA